VGFLPVATVLCTIALRALRFAVSLRSVRMGNLAVLVETDNSRSIAKSGQTAPNLKYNNLAQCANYRSSEAVALLTTIGINEQLTQIILS
jgi:hypothetical protein